MPKKSDYQFPEVRYGPRAYCPRCGSEQNTVYHAHLTAFGCALCGGPVSAIPAAAPGATAAAPLAPDPASWADIVIPAGGNRPVINPGAAVEVPFPWFVEQERARMAAEASAASGQEAEAETPSATEDRAPAASTESPQSPPEVGAGNPAPARPSIAETPGGGNS